MRGCAIQIMSCNGCRVLRKGCSESCILRPCLQWIEDSDAQGHATVFLAKFFGRAGLMGFINAVPDGQRPGKKEELWHSSPQKITIAPGSSELGSSPNCLQLFMARQVNVLGLIWPRSVVTWEGMSSKNFVNISAENINLLSHSRVEQFMLSTAWLLLMMLSLRKQPESVTSGCDLESVGNRSADESTREKTLYLFLSEIPT